MQITFTSDQPSPHYFLLNVFDDVFNVGEDSFEIRAFLVFATSGLPGVIVQHTVSCGTIFCYSARSSWGIIVFHSPVTQQQFANFMPT